MSTRLFAVLFTALFLIGIVPVLLFQSSGSAGAGVTTGFLAFVQDMYHAAGMTAIGLLSAWLGGEVILLMPLCALLMLITGSLTEINGVFYHALHMFILGAILLFGLCISLLRKKILLVYFTPVSAWAFFTGGDFMHDVPSITTPLFFMMGIIVGSALVVGIGVTLGIALTDKVREWLVHFKVATAFATFLSLF